MGCPSNVRLYTSYYNNFIMDPFKALDLEQRSLGLFRYMTLFFHTFSIIMAAIALSNLDSQKGVFPRHDLIVELKNSDGSVEKITKTIENLNALWMQFISDIVVLVTALILWARDTNLIDKGQTFYKDGVVMRGDFSFLHMLSYGFTSISSAIMFYIYFAGDDFVIALIIGICALFYEVCKHYTEVGRSANFKTALGVASFGFIGTEILILTITNANNTKKETDALLAAMLVSFFIKLLHEMFHNLDFEFYSKNSDRRHGHVIMDLAIKGGLAWSIILREMHDTGSVVTKDESEGLKNAMPWITMVLAVVGMGISLIPALKADKRSDDEAPSGTMEEKTRMLQVA